MSQPFRAPWDQFPKLVSHTRTSQITYDRSYKSALAGDLSAARSLVSRHYVPGRFRPIGRVDFVASPSAIAHNGQVSAIPAALALAVAADLGAKYVPGIVQANFFERTSPTQPNALTMQPVFDGEVPQGSWVIVQPHVHLGSSIANLRGFLISEGSTVLGATSLTHDLFKTNLAPDQSVLDTLKRRFSNELDSSLSSILGFDSLKLTNREAYFVNGLQSLSNLRDQHTSHVHRLGFGQ